MYSTVLAATGITTCIVCRHTWIILKVAACIAANHFGTSYCAAAPRTVTTLRMAFPLAQQTMSTRLLGLVLRPVATWIMMVF
jgi:hypothetical protein